MLTQKPTKHGLLVSAIGRGMPTTNVRTVLYVDDDGLLDGNCESWETPCKYLQDAIASALSNPTVVEIHVAAGVSRFRCDCPGGAGKAFPGALATGAESWYAYLECRATPGTTRIERRRACC